MASDQSVLFEVMVQMQERGERERYREGIREGTGKTRTHRIRVGIRKDRDTVAGYHLLSFLSVCSRNPL